jgi:trk system potassium uptake protein TrkA
MSSFGFYLATALAKEGIEILAIDIDEEKVEKVKDLVHQAVMGDGTDRSVLESLGLRGLDGVVVSLGQIEPSMLTTLHLKEMKIKRILTKALSEDHGKILEMIGATDIIFPEKDMAFRVARTLTHDNILDFVPLVEGYSIIEIAPPVSFVGKSLIELDLRRHYGVMVIVVKQMVPYHLVPVPQGDYVIKDSDVLVLMGVDKDLKQIQNVK